MNQTLCNGKFKFVDELTEEAMCISEEVDREIEEKKTDEERALDARSAAFCERARNAIFRYIEHLGYKLNDSSVGDGYFLFPMGSGSVTHFHLKGFWLKNYRFGIWLYPKRYYDYVKYDDMTEEQRDEYLKLPEHERDNREIVGEIFQQHEDYIDKFKPSASSAVVKIDKRDLDDLMEWVEKKENGSRDTDIEDELVGVNLSVRDLGYLLSFMVHHPFYHFADFFPYAGDRPSWWTDSFAFNHPILYFVKMRIMFHFGELKKKILIWYGFRKALNACKKLAKEDCVSEVSMVLFSAKNPGLSTSFLYEIHVVFGRDTSDDEMSTTLERHLKTEEIVEYEKYHHVAKVMSVTRQPIADAI